MYIQYSQYIHHVLCPYINIRADNLATTCVILPDYPLNLSNHLPIVTSLSLLLLSSGILNSSGVSAQDPCKPNWKKCSDDQISRYSQLVLDSLPGISQSTIWAEQHIHVCLTIDRINTVILSSSTLALPQVQFVKHRRPG